LYVSLDPLSDLGGTLGTERWTDARILIVDDQVENCLLLEALLEQEGYTQVRWTTASTEACPIFEDWHPDLVLLDLHMPKMDGFAVMEQLTATIHDSVTVPILVLTASVDPSAKKRALASGAKDFLTKPFDHIEVTLRIRNLLETRRFHLWLETKNHDLQEAVEQRTKDLEEARLEALHRLALAAEYRDDVTGKHTLRVGRTAGLLAEALDLRERDIDLIRRAAPLHDVGKIGIPDRILLKPGQLDLAEYEAMKQHSMIGANILGGSRIPLLNVAERVALTHHERWNGSGYPNGVKEERIDIAGRIVAVADVFDALMHERPYKRAWSLERSIDEIRQRSGSQFDPKVSAAFLELVSSGAISDPILGDPSVNEPTVQGA